MWVVLLAAVAVAVSVAARYNTGYVLLVLHPYRIELSLNLLVALLFVGFFVLYALARFLAHVLALPSDVRRWRARRRAVKGRRALLAALKALFEGRLARAEKAAAKAMARPEFAAIAGIVAARAAHGLRATGRRDGYLDRDELYREADAAMRETSRARMLLDDRHADDARAALGRLPRLHTGALRLELEAAQQAGDWDGVMELAARLRRAGGLDETIASATRRHAILRGIERRAHDAAVLREWFDRLPAEERRDARVTEAAARALMALGECRAAHTLVEKSLAAQWNGDLVPLYADCLGEDAVRQIERAEGWLKAHPADAGLLLALGKLCAHQQLWGKARTYFEASLSLEDGYAVHMELARLLEELGEPDPAREHYRRSLELAVARLREAGGGQGAAPGGGPRALPGPRAGERDASALPLLTPPA